MSVIRDAQESNQPESNIQIPNISQGIAQGQPYAPPTVQQIPGLVQPELPADAGALPPIPEIQLPESFNGGQLPDPNTEVPQFRMPDSVQDVLNPQILFGGPTPEQRVQSEMTLPQVNYSRPLDTVIEQLNIDRTPTPLNSTRNPFSGYSRGLLNGIGEWLNPQEIGNITDTVGLFGNNFGDYGTGVLGRFFYMLDNIQNVARGVAADVARGVGAGVDVLQRGTGNRLEDWEQRIRALANPLGFFTGLNNTQPEQASRAEFYRLTEDGTHMPYVVRALTGQDLSPLNWQVDADGSFNPFGQLGNVNEPQEVGDFTSRFFLGLGLDVILDPTNSVTDYVGRVVRREAVEATDNTLPPPVPSRGQALPGVPNRPQLPPSRPNWTYGDNTPPAPQFPQLPRSPVDVDSTPLVDENGIRYRPIPVPNIPSTVTVQIPVIDNRIPQRLVVPQTIDVDGISQRRLYDAYTPQPNIPDLLEAVRNNEPVRTTWFNQTPRLTSDNIRLLNSYEPIIPNTSSINRVDTQRIIDSLVNRDNATYYRSLIPEIGVPVPLQLAPVVDDTIELFATNTARIQRLVENNIFTRLPDDPASPILFYQFFSGERVTGELRHTPVADFTEVSFFIDNSVFTSNRRGIIPIGELRDLRRSWNNLLSRPEARGMSFEAYPSGSTVQEIVQKATAYESLGFRAYDLETSSFSTIEELVRRYYTRVFSGQTQLAEPALAMRFVNDGSMVRIARNRIDLERLVRTINRPVGEYTRTLVQEARQPGSDTTSIVERILHPNLLDDTGLDEVARTLPDEIRPVDVPAATVDYRAELRKFDTVSSVLEDTLHQFNTIYDEYEQVKNTYAETAAELSEATSEVTIDNTIETIRQVVTENLRTQSRETQTSLNQLFERQGLDDIAFFDDVYNSDEYVNLVRQLSEDLYDDTELADVFLEFQQTRSRTARNNLNEYLLDNGIDDTALREAIAESDVFNEIVETIARSELENSDLVTQSLNRFQQVPTPERFDNLRNQILDKYETILQQLRAKVSEAYDNYMRQYDTLRNANEVERIEQINRRMDNMREQVRQMTEELGQGNRNPCL